MKQKVLSSNIGNPPDLSVGRMSIYIRFPVMSLWFKWKHRHETPEQREQRVSETKKRFRDIYDSIRETVPESKSVMEVNEWLDPLMDELLGKKK